jgi:hypothetical protein
MLMHDDLGNFVAEDEPLKSALGQFGPLAHQTLGSIDDLKFQIAERERAKIRCGNYPIGWQRP